jgi:hypothetical protein
MIYELSDKDGTDWMFVRVRDRNQRSFFCLHLVPMGDEGCKASCLVTKTLASGLSTRLRCG